MFVMTTVDWGRVAWEDDRAALSEKRKFAVVPATDVGITEIEVS